MVKYSDFYVKNTDGTFKIKTILLYFVLIIIVIIAIVVPVVLASNVDNGHVSVTLSVTVSGDDFNTNGKKGINLNRSTIHSNTSILVDTPPKWPLLNDVKLDIFRTYSYRSGHNRTYTDDALKAGYEILVGIDINSGPDGEDGYKEQLKTLSENPYIRNVIGVGIGNEFSTSEIQNVQDAITFARTLFPIGHAIKLTTVFKNSNDWFQKSYPPQEASFTDNAIKLLSLVDVVSFNLYTYFSEGDFSIEKATSFTADGHSVMLNMMASVRYAMNSTINLKNKLFWVTELGWSTKPRTINGKDQETTDWANVQNAKLYYKNFIDFNITDEKVLKYVLNPDDPSAGIVSFQVPDAMFYFVTRDTTDETTKEYFGIFTENTESFISKFDV